MIRRIGELLAQNAGRVFTSSPTHYDQSHCTMTPAELLLGNTNCVNSFERFVGLKTLNSSPVSVINQSLLTSLLCVVIYDDDGEDDGRRRLPPRRA